MSGAAADTRWRLFAAQALLFGLYSGMLVIPASSVFLGEFGPDRIPWTYVVVAVASIVGTPALARSVRRWPLARIGTPVWVALGVCSLGGWLAIEVADAAWVSAPLWVLFPIELLIGFFLLGGQAGRVYDLREMKAQFPRVIMGFPLGFLAAGVAADRLIGWFGGVHRLLPVGAASAFGIAGLIALAGRRFPAELATVEHGAVASDSPRSSVPLRRLLATPYIALLLAYQMLSQLGTQLVDYLVYERAAARYTGADELGRFVARFSTVLNLADLVFLVFVAGFLLRRFGMRIGLSINPLAVTLLVVGAVTIASGSGIASTGVFVMIMAARISDIAFTDGATRTAINTAYQAVPSSERLAAQATIEGFGVPIALGLTGVLLLVLQQVDGVGTRGVAVITAVVGAVWTVAGVFVFRAYTANLRLGLAERVLAPASLDLDDPATRGEVDRMLASGDDRAVWLAISALGDHPGRIDRLAALAGSANAGVAEAAFAQLVTDDPSRALAAARSLCVDPDVATALDADALLVRDTADAASAGRIAAALEHADPQVRQRACRAAMASDDPRLVAAVVEGLRRGADPRPRVASLVQARDAAAPHLATALENGDVRLAGRLVRGLGAATPSPQLAAVLAPHVDHPDRDVAIAVRHGLARHGAPLLDDDTVDALLRVDAALAGRSLAVDAVLPHDPRAEVLRRSVHDELVAAAGAVLATLALVDPDDVVRHAARGLASGDDRTVARAVETLELHLGPKRARLVLPVIDRRLADDARLAALRAVVDVPAFDLRTAFDDLAHDPAGVWRRTWLAECATATRAVFGLA